MFEITRRGMMAGAAAVAAASGSSKTASAQTQLKVIVFPGMSNLAQFSAEAQGFYKKRGLEVELLNTPNSTELRRGLAEGRYHIAQGGVDNAVAQVENDKTDLFIFMGGNSGLNSLIVQPEINSYEDLRGKTMAVDSPNTAFALLLYKMLDVKGIKRKEYEVKAVGATHLRIQAMLKDKTFAAAILSPPGSIQAKRAGLKDFGSAVSVVGPYQSDAGWVLRSWGKANEDALVRYIAANIEGIRWALNPGQPGGADGAGREPPQAASRHRHRGAEGCRRAEGLRHRRSFRSGGFPQRAEAARRHARHLGRQAACAGQVS